MISNILKNNVQQLEVIYCWAHLSIAVSLLRAVPPLLDLLSSLASDTGSTEYRGGNIHTSISLDMIHTEYCISTQY
jgi:hypothetical protein